MNPQYPKGENGTDTCQVTIEKANNVCQLRLDFEDFTLAQPDENGLCTTDSFMVRTTVGERLPILCGENSGQHSKYQLNVCNSARPHSLKPRLILIRSICSNAK